jgi:hypothetical protein
LIDWIVGLMINLPAKGCLPFFSGTPLAAKPVKKITADTTRQLNREGTAGYQITVNLQETYLVVPEKVFFCLP